MHQVGNGRDRPLAQRRLSRPGRRRHHHEHPPGGDPAALARAGTGEGAFEGLTRRPGPPGTRRAVAPACWTGRRTE
ncbi:MAG: hypothetical protein MZV64_70715 [Ignavibacteriales bacterium]|nr:hypothetical protein [Ignavibacteriales bacterium]